MDSPAQTVKILGVNVERADNSEALLADVVVGARGWLHKPWIESFYPEDIPQDWRLGFYANEFNTLLVPWSQWSESVAALEAELDDVADDFHLYLELPLTQQPLPAHLSEIKDHVTGLVCLTTESSAWQAAAAEFDIELLTLLAENNDFFQRFTTLPARSKASLILMQSSGIEDLVMMREQLEKALQNTEKRLDIVFTDEIPDMEAMQNTRMIAELMGA